MIRRSSSPCTTPRRRSSTSNLSNLGSRKTSSNSLVPNGEGISSLSGIPNSSSLQKLRSQSPALTSSNKSLLQRTFSPSAQSSSARDIRGSGLANDRFVAPSGLVKSASNNSQVGVQFKFRFATYRMKNLIFLLQPVHNSNAQMSERSDSSGSIINSSASSSTGTTSGPNESQPSNASNCDSSSEVSDEGYKSSQGGKTTRSASKSNIASQKALAVKLESQSIAENGKSPMLSNIDSNINQFFLFQIDQDQV